MSKEDCIEVSGTIVEKFPSGLFSVQLDQERIILAHLAGKLRRNRIRVLAGDRVTLRFELDTLVVLTATSAPVPAQLTPAALSEVNRALLPAVFATLVSTLAKATSFSMKSRSIPVFRFSPI